MRILHYIYGLHVGGAESFLRNEVDNLSVDYEFDFAIQSPKITNEFFLKYIGEHNSKVYIIPKYTHPIKQYKALKKILRCGNYDFVHVHMNSAVNPIPLIIPRVIKDKRPKFIFHSHSSTNNNGGLIGWLLHKFNTKLLISKMSYKVACSEVAGKWMFGHKSRFIQINNSIDANQFKFNFDNRKRIRHELNIPLTAKVIGSVGRFVVAKNHKFMIECFSEIYKQNKDTYLLLVGQGGLFESVKRQASDLGISDRVVFTGLRTDIPAILSAMDCFFMPSLFEGFGFTAVEAQANGLIVLVSDSVPSIVNLDNYCKFISLDYPIETWCNEINKVLKESGKFDRSHNPVKESLFDVPVMVKQLKELYK